MTKMPSPEEVRCGGDDEVLLTPEARARLAPAEIWYPFGGRNGGGDSYDTKEDDFEQELDRFWADLVGPDEQLRRSVMEALAGLKPAWQSVKVFASGRIRVQFKGRTPKTIQPSRPHQS